MDRRFAELVGAVEARHQELLAMQPITASDIPPKSTPIGGVYLFSEGDAYLYAGRTKRLIRKRIRNQFGANPDAASFPWLIARQETGMRATCKKKGSRKDLLANPKFKEAYDRAKKRICKMQVRYVHEPDPVRQTLLEIYVAVATKAKYNNFDTH